MGKFKKNPPELVEYFDDIVGRYGQDRRKMFGCPVYFIGGNMFSGLFEDSIFLRLPEKEKEKLLKENDEVTPFEPLKGKKMKEYVTLPETVYNDGAEMKRLLEISTDYLLTLPPKEKKKG
jgi:TfoX/Sxy family transcriptional regulator of competence genes